MKLTMSFFLTLVLISCNNAEEKSTNELSCIAEGTELQTGESQSKLFYASTADFSCNPIVQTRICDNGSFSEWDGNLSITVCTTIRPVVAIVTDSLPYQGLLSIRTSLSDTVLQNVKVGEFFKLAGKIVKTDSTTTVGNLYFPLDTEFKIGQAITQCIDNGIDYCHKSKRPIWSDIDPVIDPLSESDILFSSRWSRPDTEWNKYTYEMFDAYRATRLVWHYSFTNSIQLAYFTDNNIPSQCTIQSSVITRIDETQRICNDFTGKPIPVPWLADNYFSDITSDAHQQLHWSTLQSAIDQGCSFIQQDDSTANYFSFSRYGGCFSDTTNTLFQRYLKDNYSATELSLKGITNIDLFDYALYLQNLNAPSGSAFQNWTIPNDLKTEYNHFIKIYIIDYFNNLKLRAQTYSNKRISFSNNHYRYSDKESHWLHNAFDWTMKEQSEAALNPLDLYQTMAYANALGSKMVITARTDSGDININRKTIATAYALGHLVIVPWDVWRAGAERLFLDASHFDDLTELIESQKEQLDNYEFVDFFGQNTQGSILSKTLSNSTLLAHASGAPKVTSVSYSDVNPGYSTIRLDTNFSDNTVTSNSSFRFRHGTVTTGIPTIVGNIYVKGDVRDIITKGEPCLEYKIGDKHNIYDLPRNYVDSAYIEIDESDAFVSVRRKYSETGKNSSNLHVVNWQDIDRNITIRVDTIKVFGEVPEKLFLRQGNQEKIELAFVNYTSTWIEIILPNIKTWGILTTH